MQISDDRQLVFSIDKCIEIVWKMIFEQVL